MIYLDSAATTPVRREVLEAMWPYLSGEFGNPSSHHSVGESAARALADARAEVAAWLGCRAGEVVFTSGGTESDNLAVKGIALASRRGRHLVTSRIEHQAILESAAYLERFHGFIVDYAPVDSDGVIAPGALEAILRPDTALVSIALADNEIGTIQQISALSAATHAAGVPFHTDAVQAAPWLDLDVARLGVDALSVSGHKLGAPKGTGVLYVSSRVALEPVLHGGGQERGRRSGTENVAGAVGLATAVRLHQHDRTEGLEHARSTQRSFIAAVLDQVPGAQLTGHPDQRLPGTASFVFPGTGGESVLLELERRGIICSSGSACAAGTEEASHVLTALGYPEDVARSAVRFTWEIGTTTEALVPVARAIAESVTTIQALSAPSVLSAATAGPPGQPSARRSPNR